MLLWAVAIYAAAFSLLCELTQKTTFAHVAIFAYIAGGEKGTFRGVLGMHKHDDRDIIRYR